MDSRLFTRSPCLRAPAIRGTGLTESLDRTSASVRLDVGRPDHPRPLLGVIGDVFAEVGGRAWKHGATKLGKARLHLGIGKPCIDLAVELLNDFGRRGLWCADACPNARFVVRHKL